MSRHHDTSAEDLSSAVPPASSRMASPRMASSRMAVADLIDAAVSGMFAKPVRAFLTALGTVLGIGSLVVTMGIARTAGAQIVERFDALAATTVSVEAAQRPGPGGGNNRSVLPWDVEDRLNRLNGVVSSGALADVDTGSAPHLHQRHPRPVRSGRREAEGGGGHVRSLRRHPHLGRHRALLRRRPRHEGRPGGRARGGGGGPARHPRRVPPAGGVHRR